MKDAIVEQRPEVLSILLNHVMSAYRYSGVRHVELSVSVSDLLSPLIRSCLLEHSYSVPLHGHGSVRGEQGHHGEGAHGEIISATGNKTSIKFTAVKPDGDEVVWTGGEVFERRHDPRARLCAAFMRQQGPTHNCYDVFFSRQYVIKERSSLSPDICDCIDEVASRLMVTVEKQGGHAADGDVLAAPDVHDEGGDLELEISGAAVGAPEPLRSSARPHATAGDCVSEPSRPATAGDPTAEPTMPDSVGAPIGHLTAAAAVEDPEGRTSPLHGEDALAIAPPLPTRAASEFAARAPLKRAPLHGASKPWWRRHFGSYYDLDQNQAFCFLAAFSRGKALLPSSVLVDGSLRRGVKLGAFVSVSNSAEAYRLLGSLAAGAPTGDGSFSLRPDDELLRIAAEFSESDVLEAMYPAFLHNLDRCSCRAAGVVCPGSGGYGLWSHVLARALTIPLLCLVFPATCRTVSQAGVCIPYPRRGAGSPSGLRRGDGLGR